MGGRGRNSNHLSNQINLFDIELKHQVDLIIHASEKMRDNMSAAGGMASTKAKKCACCGNYSLPFNSEYETCPICGWIDDPYQNTHRDSLSGKNTISLQQARDNFKKASANNNQQESY